MAEISGFNLNLRPQNTLGVAFRLTPELRDALVQAQQAGRSASFRLSQDSRGQVSA